MMRYRHIASALLVLAILFLPYWAYAPLIAAAVVVFPFYWEAIVLGFLADALYGPPGSYRAALAALALVALLLPVRERLRWTS